MKTSTRPRSACVVALALLVLSSAFVFSAAASGTTTTSAQNANTRARRKKTTARRRRARRTAPAAKETTHEDLHGAEGMGVVRTSPNVDAPASDEPPPPPKPLPKPKSAIVSGGILNGKAISKPAPAYPPIARAARAEGLVTVQIVVDEEGRVISASAVSGHPLLQQSAVAAARQARFSPTRLSGQPVRVTGVITYNFVLNPPTPY